MNIKRFHAPTSREALAKARMAFGDGTLILSNRPIAGGVEVVATAEDSLGALEHGGAQAAPEQEQPQHRHQEQQQAAPARQAPVFAPLRRAAEPAAAAQRSAPASPVQEDTEQLAMSTLSFQDYVRERMLRRRHEAIHGKAEPQPPLHAAQPPQHRPAPLPRSASFSDRVAHQDRAPVAAPPRHNPLLQAQPQPASIVRPAPAQQPLPQSPLAFATTAPAPAPIRHALPAEFIGEPAPQRRRAAAAPIAAAPAISEQALMGELQSMRDLIEDRFSTLTWLGQARQDPIQSNLMLKLIRAGYSPALARAVLERLPEDLSAADSVRWLMEVLERNLRTDAGERPIWEQGGIFALVGATGVGKTTTAAKLAALCARVHGPASVGLITLDTYRVAAHEQLRTYGRMLGVVAHLAHDRAALQDLLGLLAGKKMVLIDTTGIAPRDPRKRDMLELLDLPGVNRLLVVNAGSHGDTLDDMLTAFKTSGSQQAILSKVDEAVKLGPAVDALVRHQMVLRGVTTGQRVPEDWESADAGKLVRMSMRAPAAKSAFDPKAADLNFIFSRTPDAVDRMSA